VWRWDQAEPFGDSPADDNPSGAGTFDLPLRLPGQYYDAESGLHYNNFRDYDPSLGRYGESDPIGPGGGDDSYQYVGADPMRFVDPLGLYLANPARRYYGGGGGGGIRGGGGGTGLGAALGVGAIAVWNALTHMNSGSDEESSSSSSSTQGTTGAAQKHCPPGKECNPPAGTRCYLGPHLPSLGERPHPKGSSGWHYHIYQMYQFGDTCEWKRVRDKKGGWATEQPAGLSYCQSYPSFVKQMPEMASPRFPGHYPKLGLVASN